MSLALVAELLRLGLLRLPQPFAEGDHLPEKPFDPDAGREGGRFQGPDRGAVVSPAFHHFRDRDGVEVDLVLERGANEVAAIEVKAAATVTGADFRGLRKLKDAAGKRFRAGIVLYDGESSARFGERLYAVPIRALWDMK